MSDRRLSEVIGCQADDLHLVDNVAPAYAYREAYEQENEDAHGRMVLVAILLLIVVAGLMRFWVWPGIRDGMTRAEMAREGR